MNKAETRTYAYENIPNYCSAAARYMEHGWRWAQKHFISSRGWIPVSLRWIWSMFERPRVGHSFFIIPNAINELLFWSVIISTQTTTTEWKKKSIKLVIIVSFLLLLSITDFIDFWLLFIPINLTPITSCFFQHSGVFLCEKSALYWSQ